MHAVSSYRGNRPTHTHTHTHLYTHTNTSLRPACAANKQTGPITVHCAAAIARNVNIAIRLWNYSRPRAPISFPWTARTNFRYIYIFTWLG